VDFFQESEGMQALLTAMEQGNISHAAIMGSDVVGRFSSLGDTMQGFEPVLQALPADIAQAIAQDNFLALLPQQRQP